MSQPLPETPDGVGTARPRPSILADARIVLGVSGGIAAYKAADLASKLVQAGATVDVILTAGAREFIQPLTFQALTKRPVYSGAFEGWSDSFFGHITLARDADALLVAPATANTLARLAGGFADDMLHAVALSTRAPLVIAPAMEQQMWRHPATQENVATLVGRGATIVPPASGRLASGYEGEGRLAPTASIVGVLRGVLGRDGALAGRHVVVTAGGTQEPLDPVRFIGNRSSGQMGVALAEAARDRGAAVTLIAGPTVRDVPSAAHSLSTARVGSASELLVAVQSATENADVLIMAAAVADFRPRQTATQKIKKQAGQETVMVELVRNPDVVGSIDRPGLLKVGFAAETEDLVANARQKLGAKGLALIVANDAVATIGSAESTATLLRCDREPQPLPRMSKDALAAVILEEIAMMLDERGAVDDA
ncbi:MAG: bifunctional phosphopantothenoylcysteine decarboxylase/phosphopantothenate--cysteine ligase CoaBC [Chloroflexota bacterium]|nr:bifunctional phosphopantothenoylcysteine decarboxylase/phosphopantothenate--cysteine ligase CoaBC [Chloroflexota bacterium]